MRQIVKETGFDIVFDSQQVFRVLMDSMSRPGKINKLGDFCFSGSPGGLSPYVFVLLKTLGDHTVTFSIAGDMRAAWERYLEINTGAQPDSVDCSDYVIFQGSIFFRDILAIKRGSIEFPEDSATAIITVDNLGKANSLGEKEAGMLAAPACALTMRGPGIKDVITLYVGGLDKKYGQALAETNAGFPLGIDIILVDAEGRLACIPRTTRLEVA